MTARRAAGYFVAGSLAIAWFASAASVLRSPAPRRVPTRDPQSVIIETVAADVQAQTGRLRKRLAAAPTFTVSDRNPFTFGSAPEPRTPTRARVEPRGVPVVPPAPAIPAGPALTLVGVAENKTADGLVRTAMIAGPGDELFMAKIGDAVTTRYVVLVVGADAVELKDTLTGTTRRLFLQQ